ncbi:hypothetical protein [Actinoplanes sp. GCM10030250]|uniref:hypothetical protein n=1 Tax=Actinoplanes sp. GCM10030250 TaxID=3273376 RepID=UPI003611E69E
MTTAVHAIRIRVHRHSRAQVGGRGQLSLQLRQRSGQGRRGDLGEVGVDRVQGQHGRLGSGQISEVLHYSSQPQTLVVQGGQPSRLGRLQAVAQLLHLGVIRRCGHRRCCAR